MNVYIAGIMALVMWLTIVAGALTSIIVDAMHSRLVWVIVDMFVSPVGVVRGWLMWLGIVG